MYLYIMNSGQIMEKLKIFEIVPTRIILAEKVKYVYLLNPL